jgi:hypothetical protein
VVLFLSISCCRFQKKFLKTFFVFALCLVIILSPCTTLRPVKTQAAMTGTAIVGGAVAVAGILAALGITCYFSDADNRAAFKAGCQSIYEDCSDAVDDVVAKATRSAKAGMASLLVPAATLKTVFESAVKVIPQSAITFSTFENLCKAYQMDTWATTVVDQSSFFDGSMSDITSVVFLGRLDTGLTSLNGQTISINFANTNAVTLGYSMVWQAEPRYFGYHDDIHIVKDGDTICSFSSASVTPWGLYYTYLLKIVVKGVSYYSLLCPDRSGSTQYWLSQEIAQSSATETIPEPAQDMFMPSVDKYIADGVSAMNTKIDDVINELKEKVGDVDGNIPLSIPRGTEVGDEAASQSQSDVLEKDVSDVEDRERDIDTNKTNDVTETKEQDKSTAAENDTTTTTTSTSLPKNLPRYTEFPSALTKKFPFCIPFDLVNSIKTLSATAEAPKIVVPVKYSQWGVDTSFTIDLSKFDTVATLNRYCMSILWVIGLMFITRRLIWR